MITLVQSLRVFHALSMINPEAPPEFYPSSK
jgi:hypothetical protein